MFVSSRIISCAKGSSTEVQVGKIKKEREKRGELEGGDTIICVVHTVEESETHYVA